MSTTSLFMPYVLYTPGPKKDLNELWQGLSCCRENTPYKSPIEIKRLFRNPLYKFPSLYNDIAVIELGRRIEYDFDKFGDSPACMDQG